MTEQQNEDQKRKCRMAVYDQRRISEVFPDVEQIQIAYEVEHRSAFGISKESRTAICGPEQTNILLLIVLIGNAPLVSST